MKHLYKTTVSLVALMLITLSFQAQNSKVTNAKFAYDAALENIQGENFEKAASDLKEAIEEIEPATSHEKTSMKEKTWRYRGMIYELVSRYLDQAGFNAISETNPVVIAAESYAKAKELDKKGSYEAENSRGIAVMQNLAMNAGINGFNSGDFAQAFEMFSTAADLAEGLGMVDTLALYNAGLAADRAEDLENAVKYYQKTLDIGYPEPGLYKFISDIQKKLGDEAAAEKAIMNGLEAFPEDQGLMIDMVNIYLEKDQLDKAIVLLEETVAKEPENAMLRYSVGSVYDNLGETMKAREAYEEAIRLDGNLFDANYNLGASYYNEAVEMLNKANEIPPYKVKEYEAAKKAADDVLLQALPYLEKAHELQPEDEGTIRSLGEIYTRTNQLEKRKEIMGKLEK